MKTSAHSFQIFKNQSIAHKVTGREGGVSKGEFGSLNLSFNTPDPKENTWENRKRVASSLDLASANELILAGQVHGNESVVADDALDYNPLQPPQADAVITQRTDIAIGTLCADCVPVLLFDPVRKVAAAIHAGWKGTVKRIAERTIERLKSEFAVAPATILAGIGPSISVKHYEVGLEVASVFKEKLSEDAEFVFQPHPKPEKVYLDLWKANELQLLRSGMKKENIEIADICTFENHETYFSARRNQGGGGRFGTFIKIR